MRVEHLLTFVVVAEEGNITKAAERLFRTQPAISTQLRQLTEAFGEPLYTKYSDGIKLTEAGEGLLVHARAVARAYQTAKTYSHNYQSLQYGTLNLAASLTTGVYLLPELLVAFEESYPKLSIQLSTRYSKDALAMLLKGEVDIAFVELPLSDIELPDKSYEVREFYQDAIALVAHPEHPLAKLSSQRLKLKDLQEHKVVWAEATSGTRHVVEGMLKSEKVSLEQRIQITGIEAIKRAVSSNLGVAFLSRLAVKDELESGELVELPLDNAALSRSFSIIHPELELCTHGARAFLEFLPNIISIPN